MKPITVLLAEDHMVVRQGLRKLLEVEDDLQVVGEAESGRQAVEMTGKLHPAVEVHDGISFACPVRVNTPYPWKCPPNTLWHDRRAIEKR